MKKWVILGIGVVALGSILVIGGTMESKVLAGKMSFSLGEEQSWVNPSSVRARKGDVISIEVFNGVAHSRQFQIEKVAPYDSGIKDACRSVEVDTDYLVLGSFEPGVFNVSIVGSQAGEAWIQITPEYEGMLQPAWIVRIAILP